MSTIAARTAHLHAQEATPERTRAAVRWARAACLVGAAQVVPFTAIWIFAALTDDGPFRHTADYWFTGIGIPLVLAPIVLIAALRSLQQGRDGRLGLAGQVVATVSLLAFVPVLAYTVAVGEESSFGPTYVLATLVSIVGLALFVAGSFRAGLLPKRLLAAWLVAWIVGGTLGVEGGALLLGAVYLVIAAVLPRRVRRAG
jgi:hypothetical protein